MSYTIEEINHIIYNNRSYDGVVKNFIPKLTNIELLLLLEIGKQLKFINKLVNHNSSIIIDRDKLDLQESDIQLFPNQISNLKFSNKFSEDELRLLEKKKIPKNIIDRYNISSLSQIKNMEILKNLGVTTHPILKKLLGDGLSDGLIIPLYKNGKLINTAFRKTNELTKLKYGITVPSLDFWGDEILENDEIWMCEGLFDMMALQKENKKCISSSSCSLNDLQYFKIINKKPKIVNIFTDNDVSGYKSALKSQKIFGLNGIQSRIYSSVKGKDAAEHFFELELDWNTINEIKITKEMISREENTFDFLRYLEDRKF